MLESPVTTPEQLTPAERHLLCGVVAAVRVVNGRRSHGASKSALENYCGLETVSAHLAALIKNNLIEKLDGWHGGYELTKSGKNHLSRLLADAPLVAGYDDEKIREILDHGHNAKKENTLKSEEWIVLKEQAKTAWVKPVAPFEFELRHGLANLVTFRAEMQKQPDPDSLPLIEGNSNNHNRTFVADHTRRATEHRNGKQAPKNPHNK